MSRSLLGLLLMAVLVASQANAVALSVQLKDTIKQGSGSIDLFRAKQQKK